MAQREIVAMILAGGQGSRLGVLTKRLAKPAVMYGGKFRIIDFALSNCVNSGITNVGVLTQYQPLKLNSHIGIGKPWDLDRLHGGVTILSPYVKKEKGEWFKGTANAIYQNIEYLDKLNPENVLLLSGDHIYKMDYSRMLEFHKRKDAQLTISVINVPLEEASRYGIMNVEDDRIVEFEEKPREPKSTLASMGIYIFKWDILREYLILDDEEIESDHDFGKDTIPAMIGDKRRVYAYKFDGYWKDVGTIHAFWESNMELVKRVPEFNLYDQKWKIYTVNPMMPPHFISSRGSVKTSVVAEGCMIYGTVRNCVIFSGVTIRENTTVIDSIIMSDTVIDEGSFINHSIIGENASIGKNVKIGVGDLLPNENNPRVYNSGITVVGDEARVPDNVTIGRNVMVDISVNEKDFTSAFIPSGKNVLKSKTSGQEA